ncbi:TIGR03986 family type III CRISPR-associated RAMP protein [Candidatus Venteria ishoeyi]|uniref:RAMP superfamily protein n=1 Tax=Candidatus Venteria ishoeyi TaxID=1899563 RepID=A0A1H6FHC1_9GAMM|nr:TIGR03986 family CRISPR-associated RAMP protein [Candidatus Venteria ishoeyi]SEH08759.1 RAMP superfamily protein [Candidatus Venteria ishoeyi]
MSQFYHPYNFIPVTGKVNNRETPKTAYQDIQDGSSHIRHDLWQEDMQSGRVLCRLHLDTPTVVGGAHEPSQNGQPAVVKPYCRHDNIAIPANSLRGVVGSIAESLSQSALRVLEDKQYSVRKAVGDGLSAIGLLKKIDGKWELLPLTIPTLKTRSRQDYKLPALWSDIFMNGGMDLKLCLPAYVNGYKQIRHGVEAHHKKQGFLHSVNPDCFRGTGSPEFYYARLESIPASSVGDAISSAPGLKEKPGGQWMFLLGQKIQRKANGEEDILNAADWKTLEATNPAQAAQYSKGVLRIFGIDGREQDLPRDKKHELFIPVHGGERIAVSETAIEQFEQLVKESTANSDGGLPYAPKGYGTCQLQSGQLVYFDIQCDSASDNIVVSEISYSAIWRKQVDGGSHDFFKAINSDLLPWGSPKRRHATQPEQDKLTPAECLFGVVEEEKHPKLNSTRNLASRLRFSDALATQQVRQIGHPLTLKILSSPKLPCPSLYFHDKNDNAQRRSHVAKADLKHQQHRPNGRKVYLHHQPEHLSRKPWKTTNNDNAEQKMSCQPIEPGQDFYFHIDFDNLSEAELSLLLHGLRPDKAFRHRLGLGKSLGLGSVEIAVEGVFLINRSQRYSTQGLDEPRYYEVYAAATINAHQPWSALYPQEADACKQNSNPTALTVLYQNQELIDRTTLALLKTAGNPEQLQAGIAVQAPICEGQRPEQEGFKWFVENEKQRPPQVLQPISTNKLPTLNKI